VKTFTGQDLRMYMQSRVNAASMLLVVCGNVGRADLERMVKASFGSLPRGSGAVPAPAPVRHAAPSVTVVKRELPTSYITGLWPAPPFGTPESYAMTMARSVLNDRLFEEVRTKRSLSYAPHAVAGQMFANYAGIYVTAVKPETTVAVMVGELKKLQEAPLPPKTLSDKKTLFLTGYYLGMETNASQAETLARYELSGRGYAEADRLMENIRKVTAEDVQKVSKEYIQNLQFILIGSPASLQMAPFMF
jgi:zinc protease